MSTISDDENVYINEISLFIWEKMKLYYKNSNLYENNISINDSFEINKLQKNYNDLSEMYEYKTKELNEKVTSLVSELNNEEMKNRLLNNELKMQESQLKNVLHQLKNIKEEHNELIKSLKNEYKEQIDYMKIKIEESNNDKSKILNLFNEHLEKELEKRVESYKKQNEELKRENEYYYNLYVDKSKGKFYETELYPRLLAYNTKYMGGIWNIEHVGSTTSEKCDFVFKHKDSGIVILLDTKNNIQSQPVNNIDMDKFLRDVSLEENKAIGGILLANSRICNKKEFEINEHQGKTLIFISNFNQDNIGFIFSVLELIYDKHKEGQKEVDVVKVKQGVVDDIKFLKERCNYITNEKRKLESYLTVLENRFIELYGQNVDEWLNVNVKTNKPENIPSMIIDFEDLEKNRKVIGKRTKYYLCYEDPKTKEAIIQYFQNNSRKQSKMNKLEIHNVLIHNVLNK